MIEGVGEGRNRTRKGARGYFWRLNFDRFDHFDFLSNDHFLSDYHLLGDDDFLSDDYLCWLAGGKCK